MSEYRCDESECCAVGDCAVRRFVRGGSVCWRCDEHLPGAEWDWDAGPSSAAIREGCWADSPPNGGPIPGTPAHRIAALERELAEARAERDALLAKMDVVRAEVRRRIATLSYSGKGWGAEPLLRWLQGVLDGD